ncbi:MAG: response regulator, partial [Bacilli bacterium]
MLRVAICDDLLTDLENASKMVDNLLYSLNIEYEIEKYSNGRALLNSKISFDLILLDIEMDEINGIDVAREIRKYNNDSKIIFITNSTNYLQIGYTVRADRY